MSQELTHNEQRPAFAIKDREDFMKRLDEKPNRTEKQNNVDSVPISFLEHELDEVYMGLWSTTNFRYQVIANEIVGTLDLSVFDPSAKMWLHRSGSAAVMIRQKSGAELTDISSKIKNGLQMDFPKLESMCLKAAAKKLGKRFGRDLNRKFEDEYDNIYTQEIEFAEVKDDVLKELKESNDMDALKTIWAKYPDMHENKKFKAAFTSRKTQLAYAK